MHSLIIHFGMLYFLVRLTYFDHQRTIILLHFISNLTNGCLKGKFKHITQGRAKRRNVGGPFLGIFHTDIRHNTLVICTWMMIFLVGTTGCFMCMSFKWHYSKTQVAKMFTGIKIACPSSLRGDKEFDFFTFCLTTFFKHDTWKALCTHDPTSSSNVYTTYPTLAKTFQGP